MNLSKLFNSRFLLFFVILISLFFRLYNLGETPKEYYWDEMAMLVDVRSIVETGFDMHGDPWLQPIFPSYSDYKAPVFIWFASMSSVVFGPSGWSLRLVSVFAWIITLFCGIALIHYWHGTSKKLQNELQIWFAFVLGFIPWSFHFSRVGFEAFLSQALLVASLTAGFFALKKKTSNLHTILFLIASVGLGSLSSYTYFGTRYVWPILFLLQMMFFGFIPRFSKNNLRSLFKVFILTIVSLALFILALIPLVSSPYYETSQRYRLSTKSIIEFQAQLNNVYTSNSLKEIAGNSIFDRLIFHREVFFVHDFLQNIADHISIDFLFLSGDSNLRHGTGAHGLLLITFFPAFIAGFALLFKKNFQLWTFLLLWFLVALIPASIPVETPHALRSLNGLFPLSLFVSYGFVIWPNRSRLRKIYLFVVAINITLYLHYYFSQYGDNSLLAWQGDYPKITETIQQHRADSETVMIDFPDQKLFLWFLNDGGYTVSDVQSFKYSNFQLESFDGIEFSNWQPNDISVINNYSLLFIPKGEVGQTEQEIVAQSEARKRIVESNETRNELVEYLIPKGIEKIVTVVVNGSEYTLVRPYY